MTHEHTAGSAVQGLRLMLRGSVQGVGFRPWVWRVARELGLRGSVRNHCGGVCVEAFGSREALACLRERIETALLPGLRVELVESAGLERDAPERFTIDASPEAAAFDASAVALAPDLPTCSACLDELLDPASRRYRYPFIACAQCGPRYTMARQLPYDRERTAMADFPLCEACLAEYTDPGDRRFHAEATACPRCGPVLSALEWSGRVDGRAPGSTRLRARDEPALALAVTTLGAGGIVAVQGIGGFHLACDARDEAAVARLRERKRRGRKPLAVMVDSVAEAQKLAVASSEERALLASEARPIVLLRRHAECPLGRGVAPDSPMLGVLLAYTPLHTLLLRDFGGPLLMTSANRSGEPIARRLDELTGGANQGGEPLAEVVLAHDREIVAACDDSVAQHAGSGPVVLRRARGHVPRSIQLASPLGRTVLALGGQWNNTICLASGDRAWLSAHIGDIESPASVERLEETAARWLGWLGVAPDLIAHDLHLGYESTRLARSWDGVRAIGVQHHHAHLASVLAEHAVEGPAVGLIWDGTGDGGDGTSWGGELLRGNIAAVERIATFRPIALAGGERAIREPWRLTLAMLDDAFEGDPPIAGLPLFGQLESGEVEQVRALLASSVFCPSAHGVGRYFDAVGALLLMRRAVTFQGELAQALGFLCSHEDAVAYDFEVDRSTTPWTIDLRPAVRRLVGEYIDGRAPVLIADRFHATLLAVGDTIVRSALGLRGGRSNEPIVLGGGCFQNRILLDGFERRFGASHRVLRPSALPPGDGGLALGQALVADAQASNGGA